MKLIVLTAAEEDLAEAVLYYNDQRPGLGHEFSDEVKRTFRRIQENPTAWTHISRRGRRCLTARFPYGVLYSQHNETILIAGIMHLRQNPERWLDRL
ncbi:MAG: type II toxin-antitoxin system RelE/ParE family toxin [Pontiellaceae bacterium]|nr:type II toxin-antitoxin system RelE/ParE family toxin [Pontiellaceae bacterium]